MFVYVLRVVSYVKCRSSTLDVDILVVISGAPPDPSEVTPGCTLNPSLIL